MHSPFLFVYIRKKFASLPGLKQPSICRVQAYHITADYNGSLWANIEDAKVPTQNKPEDARVKHSDKCQIVLNEELEQLVSSLCMWRWGVCVQARL